MRQPQDESLENEISLTLGLPAVVTRDTGGPELSVRIRGIDRPHGFRVVVRDMLSWVTAVFELDNLSADLLAELAASSDLQWRQAFALCTAYRGVGIRIELLRNGVDHVAPGTNDIAPLEDLSLSAKILKTDSNFGVMSVATVAEAVLAVIVCLLKLDDQDVKSQTVDKVFQEEGRQFESISKRYERSRSNRAAAIAIHGKQCAVCGFDFDAIYGTIAGGYIEVHHLVPVSMMTSVRIVDPNSDLVPLCANCHRMAHRRWPPFTPTELAGNLREASSQEGSD